MHDSIQVGNETVMFLTGLFLFALAALIEYIAVARFHTPPLANSRLWSDAAWPIAFGSIFVGGCFAFALSFLFAMLSAHGFHFRRDLRLARQTSAKTVGVDGSTGRSNTSRDDDWRGFDRIE